MPAGQPIRESIEIHAPIERCWALSTRVELVQKTLEMKPVSGVTSGFITAGSRVAWRGWKFGLPTEHHTLITGFEPPHLCAAKPNEPSMNEAFFQDTQEKGRFAAFHHDHFFRESTAGRPCTVLTDEIYFRLPFGFVGRAVAANIMAPYIRRLAQQRFATIKHLAEGDGWRKWM